MHSELHLRGTFHTPACKPSDPMISEIHSQFSWIFGGGIRWRPATSQPPSAGGGPSAPPSGVPQAPWTPPPPGWPAPRQPSPFPTPSPERPAATGQRGGEMEICGPKSMLKEERASCPFKWGGHSQRVQHGPTKKYLLFWSLPNSAVMSCALGCKSFWAQSKERFSAWCCVKWQTRGAGVLRIFTRAPPPPPNFSPEQRCPDC